MVSDNKIILREYQKNILKSCLTGNTLIILPTGTGKTLIAFYTIIERLKKDPSAKAIFLAPTKPLSEQHYKNFINLFPEYKTQTVLLTGDIPPKKRESLYKSARILFLTPQTLQNDLINKKVSLEPVNTLIIDEAHRAVKKYAYVFISKEYLKQSKDPRIIALTASPGYDIKKIKSIIKNLYIQNIEIRTGYEPDISPYIKKNEIIKIELCLSKELQIIKSYIEKALNERYEELFKYGYVTKKLKGKKELNEEYTNLQAALSRDPSNFEIKKSLSILSEILKIDHFLEILETQCLYTFVKYYEDLLEKSKTYMSASIKNFLSNLLIKKSYILAKDLLKKGIEHPKIYKLLDLLQVHKNKKIIIFVQLKKTAERIKEILISKGYNCELFLGKSYMSPKNQSKILQEFSEGRFNILIATSIGEEGIDIPKVDVVIFYEPIPSEIRFIQRRGRTGRSDIGKTYILVTKGTRDEIYYWVAIKRERKMIYYIKKLQHLLQKELQDNIKISKSENNIYYLKKRTEKGSSINSNLSNFLKKEKENLNTEEIIIKTKGKDNKSSKIIIVDYREKDSGVVQALVNKGFLIKLDNLAVGDYIIGDLIIERKTILDFLNSILDGRLKEQLEKLKEYNSMLILEGDINQLYTLSSLNPNFIRKILLEIILNYNTPIYYSRDYFETAEILNILANLSSNQSELNILKKKKDIKEIRKNILLQIPGIGKQSAELLLNKYSSLKNIFEAKLPELEKILGEKKAKYLKEVYGTYPSKTLLDLFKNKKEEEK